jgi:hypothetical protein
VASWLLFGAAASTARLGIFEAGTFGALVALLIFAVLVYAMIQMARAGAPMRQIHPLPGVDALDEAIGRATEMGRPVAFIPGIGGATDPATLASFPILAHTATQSARYDTRLLVMNRDPVVYAITESIARESYLEAGRPDAYNVDDVRFLTNDQFGFAGGVFQVIEHERPAACVFYGDFAAETMLLAEVAAMAGAVQITATNNAIQMPFFMAASDYLLIGEEMYAASAYISKDPVLVGTIVGEDLYKFLMFAVIVIGIVVASVLHGNMKGFDAFFNL